MRTPKISLISSISFTPMRVVAIDIKRAPRAGLLRLCWLLEDSSPLVAIGPVLRASRTIQNYITHRISMEVGMV